MIRSLIPSLLVAAVASSTLAAPNPEAAPPATPGTCGFTRIAWVGQRLGDGSGKPLVPSPGSSVRLADGVLGVAYDDVPAIRRSRVGDPVMTCLAKLPRHCPPGDQRGRWYTTTNLRTDEAWTLPDAEHECGGA